MGKNIPLATCLAMLLSTSGLFAAGAMDDAAISRDLVGSWIVLPDSTDYNPGNAHAVETLRVDGTYIGNLFQDQNCTILINSVNARWSIKNGVLYSLYANGNGDEDDVISITGNKLTLRSHSDGTTYTRLKAKTCAPPNS